MCWKQEMRVVTSLKYWIYILNYRDAVAIISVGKEIVFIIRTFNYNNDNMTLFLLYSICAVNTSKLVWQSDSTATLPARACMHYSSDIGNSVLCKDQLAN